MYLQKRVWSDKNRRKTNMNMEQYIILGAFLVIAFSASYYSTKKSSRETWSSNFDRDEVEKNIKKKTKK